MVPFEAPTGRHSALGDVRLLTLVTATVISLLVANGAGGVRWLGITGMAFLCLAAVARPVVGLIAVLPLLYALPPTPPSIQIVEALYAVMLVIVVMRAGIPLLANPRIGRMLAIAVITLTAFAGVNLAVARANDVPMSDWLRGLMPFLFVAYAVPTTELLRRDPPLHQYLLAAAAVVAVLFSGRVIITYVLERLWEPIWYVREGNAWVATPRAIAERLGELAHGPYWTRVTTLMQQSTDALIPLALVAGFWGYVFAVRRWAQMASIIITALSLIAALMTYTRSMLLCAGLVLSGLFVTGLWKSGEPRGRALLGTTVLALIAAATIQLFDMEAIYLNRFLSMSNSMRTARAEHPGDENVTTRLEEYRVAWNMFRAAPVMGQGLGVTHDMQFATSIGQPTLKQRVAYVHNWPLYMLMTGGMIGLLVYCAVLVGPVWLVLRMPGPGHPVTLLIIASIVMMGCYALFFAVFRLMTFNLLLGLLWGLALAPRLVEKARDRTSGSQSQPG